jgi:hypothetical protein
MASLITCSPLTVISGWCQNSKNTVTAGWPA